MQQAIQDIDAIKEELVKIKLQRTNTTALDDVLIPSSKVVDSSQHASHSKGIMVGENDAIKEEELVKIKNRDEHGERNTALDVLPSSEVDSSQHASHSEEDELGEANLCFKFFSIVSNFIKIFKFTSNPHRDTDAEKMVKIKNTDDLEGRQTALDVLPSSEVDSSQHASHCDDKMVGKNDEFEIIMKVIIEHGSNKRKKVVSVVGMGGIGKTTLARRVYEDPSIAIHFDVKTWVVASQLHNKRQMLIGLLNSISKQGNVERSTDEDLALQLYQSLKGQRYIVVIDDVWSGEAWDDVSKCFPDDGNRSRVLLTTRLAEVANYTSSDNDSFSHQMHLLNQSDSWDLFCEKACRSRGGGGEFKRIGRPIVEKCKGLPLAIIVVAGLFSKLDTLNEWENIAKVLDSCATTTIAATCSKILILSYNHLPHHLKACFLYLGVFPEDYEINANELARLWSAEGIVKAIENESFDAVANKYVQELMDRNLILVSKWSCCGRKIKVFRVHDVLHAFCVREAQNESLLHVVRENGSPDKYFRWVSIQSSHFDVSKYYSARSSRSILCFAKSVSLVLEKFKLLRVLFFTDRWMRKEIVDFVHLRYLPPVLSDFKILQLFSAWNLQTLRSVYDYENYLEFPQLQHFKCRIVGRYPPKFVHQNLQSISWLKPCHCTREFFIHVPFVKKICIQRIDDRKDLNECIENLAYLQQLERLDINGMGCPAMIQLNNHIVLLKNLKRLKFYGNGFEWNEINVLCELPRLEVLKLLDDSCVGKEWELPEDDKFCELIFLQIGSTDDLTEWKANGDHFPKLEHLVLYSCKKLEKIPSGFAEISTLKSIKLEGCLPSVVTSANEIKEDQLDYGNENMIVG